jgi:hypothetical protein
MAGVVVKKRMWVCGNCGTTLTSKLDADTYTRIPDFKPCPVCLRGVLAKNELNECEEQDETGDTPDRIQTLESEVETLKRKVNNMVRENNRRWGTARYGKQITMRSDLSVKGEKNVTRTDKKS